MSPSAGPQQAANISGEVIWVTDRCLSDPQQRVSNYEDPSPLFSSTGCDVGPQLDLFNMITPFWFQASTSSSLSHTRSWNLLVSGTSGTRGRLLLLPWTEARVQSPSSYMCLPSAKLEVSFSSSPCWYLRQGYQSACVTAWYQPAISLSDCWILLSLPISSQSGHL